MLDLNTNHVLSEEDGPNRFPSIFQENLLSKFQGLDFKTDNMNTGSLKPLSYLPRVWNDRTKERWDQTENKTTF